MEIYSALSKRVYVYNILCARMFASMRYKHAIIAVQKNEFNWISCMQHLRVNP